MDKETKLVLVILVAGLLIGLGIWAGSKEDPMEVISAPKVDNFRTMAKDGFMGECLGGSATYAYCNCSFDTLYEKLGADGFVKLGNEYENTGELPAGTIEMIDACFKLL